MRLFWFALFLCHSCFVSAAQPGPTTRPAKTKEQYRSFAMTRQGDVARGKSLFLDEQKVACGRCHTTDGKGRKVGPDLSAIGDKFGRSDLIDSILNPSAT